MGTNNCIFGCPTGAKQSALVSYLPRAVEAGARIVSDARATRVTVDARGRARGIVGVITNPFTWQKHKLVVQARAVVLTCGAVQTPVLLQGSKLGNKWVGDNLLLHPNAKALAIYDDEIYGCYRDFDPHEVEDMTVADIFRSSSNVGTIRIAQLLPPGTIPDYMERFGLGRPTGTGITPQEFLLKHGDVVRLLRSGQSFRHAAAITGKGLSTVTRVARAMGKNSSDSGGHVAV